MHLLIALLLAAQSGGQLKVCGVDWPPSPTPNRAS